MTSLEFCDKHNIVNWEYILLGMTEAKDTEVCKITRADGSSSFHRDFQALLRRLDIQDLSQLYSLVQERFKNHPLEGQDLDLWGDLIMIFDPNEEDDIWLNQQYWELLRWKSKEAKVGGLLGIKELLQDMLLKNLVPLVKELSTVSYIVSTASTIGTIMGLERQPDAAASATVVSEDALAVDEGDQGRLEEDVQGLRRDVGSLRGLVERLMTDHGRFSTWMMTHMTFWNDDEEYVAVKEDEYDDLTVTRKEACRAYQEIFRIMDEGWKITILKTNTPYPSRKIRRIRACTHQRPLRNKAQYAVSRETQYAVFKIWNQYNILEDIKRGPYSKKSPIRHGFKWEEGEAAAFDGLKYQLSRVPILGLPNFEDTFIVEADASSDGIGVVLLQKGKPISFFSRKLGPRMRSATTYQKELFSIMEVVYKWRQYLVGRRFTIHMDHKSIKELMQQVADALSRMYEDDNEGVTTAFMAVIRPVIGLVNELNSENKNLEELRQLHQRLDREFHNTSSAGHGGIKKMLQTKYSMQATEGLLQPLPTPTTVWEDVSMDFITGLLASKGLTIILVVVDRFSKYAHFGTLPTNFNAPKVAKIFMEIVVKHRGFAKTIISDRDPIFMSKFWKKLCEASGTRLNHSTTYHP
ncbi:ty3-gypsy retrotransposon protein [Tanacetum coccineum]